MSRKRGLSQFGFTVLVPAILCLAAGIAAAQGPQEAANTFQVNYYSNFGSSPVATIHIVNPGTAATTLNADGVPTNGSLCADVYVYNDDEELLECCACKLTPDSERTLSLKLDLLKNPINGRNVTTDGVLKIVSTATVGGICPFPSGDTTITPTPGLTAWGTHTQYNGGGYPETETEFQAAPLSTFEFEYNERGCSAVAGGSGAGVCTCGYGD